MVRAIASHSTIISAKPAAGLCQPKKIADHKTLKINWIIKTINATATLGFTIPCCQTSHAAMAMITTVESVRATLARAWMKGICRVRMTWMMRVWVIRDSTNQPVWNRAAPAGSQQWNRYNITKNVV